MRVRIVGDPTGADGVRSRRRVHLFPSVATRWMAALALTGTPGTGKSAVARLLTRSLRVVEVRDLALAFGTGRLVGVGGLVDLRRTAEEWRARRKKPAELVVGHLAHFLPIRDVVVLRCHPKELARRLRRSPGRPGLGVGQNLAAEATDVILVETLALRRRVWEIDTTHRAPSDVAREVLRRFRLRGPASYGSVDWLSDPWVSEHLLDWSP